jgi:hypothetical protein
MGAVAHALLSGRAETAEVAETLDGLDSTKFMRVDTHAGTAGDLTVGGRLSVNNTLQAGSFTPGYSVIAVWAASGDFPHSDGTLAPWSLNGAPWAMPMIYRSRRNPDDGSGAFPFDEDGELILQGTSHGRGYHRGVSIVTTPEDPAEPSVRVRVWEEGGVSVG